MECHESGRPALKWILCVAAWMPAIGAADAKIEWNADSYRTAQHSPGTATPVPRRNVAGLAMAMYEAGMVSRLCSGTEFLREFGRSREECRERLFNKGRECSAAFQDRFPRGDDREVGRRLSHRGFVAGYLRCMRGSKDSAVGRSSRRGRPSRPRPGGARSSGSGS